MNVKEIIDSHGFILTEAAVVETLRRSDKVALHPFLEHAMLIYDDAGKEALTQLYRNYIDVARQADTPIMIGTPTWRANRERLEQANVAANPNGDAVRFLNQMRTSWDTWANKIMIAGIVGCKNDSYKPEEGLSIYDAQAFHHWQIARLAEAGADLLLGVTLPALPEATGMAQAMAQTDVPFIISFVIDKTGRILDGNSLDEAFREIDAFCNRPPLGYMINCAYPSFLKPHNLPKSALSRLIGYQANASSLESHQLDGAETLQVDDLSDWGDRMIELHNTFGIKILGGCCGTGAEHLRYITRHMR